eukprot:Tbor_TRINITY_DN3818_c0_g1::TRINITY_DN3818_c0_g1_i1::g.5589::m.5589
MPVARRGRTSQVLSSDISLKQSVGSLQKTETTSSQDLSINSMTGVPKNMKGSLNSMRNSLLPRVLTAGELGMSLLTIGSFSSSSTATDRNTTRDVFPFNTASWKRRNNDTDDGALPPITSTRIRGAEDDFSIHEKEVIQEINELRRDPAAYANKMSLTMELHTPFIDCCRMTLAQLKRFAAGKRDEERSLAIQLDALGVKKNEEKKTLTAQWAIADVEREKRNKKNPNKKRLIATFQQEEITIKEERDIILANLEDSYNKEDMQLRARYDKVSDELLRASHGVALLEQCCRKVAATVGSHSHVNEDTSVAKGLSLLTYSRSLSLASREACEDAAGVTADDARAYATRYGKGTCYGAAAFVGAQSVPQTIMEILLGLQDPLKIGRASLLSTAFNFAGCGWRRSAGIAGTEAPSRTYIILSSRFEELKAISDLDHLPLCQVKHVLPCALKEYPGSIITLDTDLPIAVIQPKCHPITCNNTAKLLLRCGEGVRICGVVYNLSDPEPQEASVGQGQTLIQHLGQGVVEVNVVLHNRGKFGLTLFAAGSEGTCTGFKMIGRVFLSSSDEGFDSCNMIYSYAITTGEFQRRRMRILSPICGTFTPSSLQTFHVSIPISAYLNDEFSNVEQELRMTSVQLDNTNKSIADLTVLAGESVKDAKKAEGDAHARLSTLAADICQLQKEAAKKRGKELDKLKNVLSQHEAEQKRLEESVRETFDRAAQTLMKLDSFQRSTRQMVVHHSRLVKEQGQLAVATDRSVPLSVVIRFARREVIVPVVSGTGNIEYKLVMRVPDEADRVCMYVNDILVVSWEVSANA